MGDWHESGWPTWRLGRESSPLALFLILQRLLAEIGVERLRVVEESISVVKIWLAVLLQLMNAAAVVLLGFVILLLSNKVHSRGDGRLRHVCATGRDLPLLRVGIPSDLVSGKVVA